MLTKFSSLNNLIFRFAFGRCCFLRLGRHRSLHWRWATFRTSWMMKECFLWMFLMYSDYSGLHYFTDALTILPLLLRNRPLDKELYGWPDLLLEKGHLEYHHEQLISGKDYSWFYRRKFSRSLLHLLVDSTTSWNSVSSMANNQKAHFRHLGSDQKHYFDRKWVQQIWSSSSWWRLEPHPWLP